MGRLRKDFGVIPFCTGLGVQGFRGLGVQGLGVQGLGFRGISVLHVSCLAGLGFREKGYV